ncbi:MAG: hypothetical protein IJC13_06260 [Clostridia bacterium]|nr:hypothetical protein [Clostridia bacterium]
MSIKDFFTRILIRFAGLFAESPEEDNSIMISWEKAVEMLYDKQLDTFSQLIKVIYSKDKSMRYVVFKDDRGLLSYELEAIYPYDDNANKTVRMCGDEVSAYWTTYEVRKGNSFFDNQKELLAQIESEHEFKQYFI